MSQNKQSATWAIWTIAGVIILAALIVGLNAANKQDAATPTPITQPAPNVLTPPAPAQAPRIDVAFVIDATGSMGDEIDAVKKEIWDIANKIMEGNPRPDVRFGIVFYQDKGDSFLVKRTDLTRNIDEVHKELMAISAGGGGDWPEHVGRGLHEALNMPWDTSPNTTRLMYLVGDAPGHDDYNDGYDLASAIRTAKDKNIKINALGCSGLETGRDEFRRIAEGTGGIYADLTYQVVVTDQNGVRRSAIHYNGEVYEADGVLERADWGKGADKLLGEGRLKPASPSVRAGAAAPGAATDNNLGDVFREDIKKEAKAKGVAY